MRYKAVGFEAGGRRQEAEVSVLDSFENSYIPYFINLKYAVPIGFNSDTFGIPPTPDN